MSVDTSEKREKPYAELVERLEDIVARNGGSNPPRVVANPAICAEAAAAIRTLSEQLERKET
jgi:hypothetical protein